MFEIVNGRTPEEGYTISSPCKPEGSGGFSGELIKDTVEASQMKAYLLLNFSRLKATPEICFSSLIPSVARQHISPYLVTFSLCYFSEKERRKGAL